MTKAHALGPRGQRYHRHPVASASAENSHAHERGAVWLRRADALVANPFFAYAAIIALQLRVIWKLWDYRDLTFGDTAGYFIRATTWAHHLEDDIVWSPLYTNFFGIFVALSNSVGSAVLAHRIVIVMAATVGVLALMRSLLGPALGLLAAAWWAVLPTNFNVEYEVHLFGVLPILLAAILVSRSESRYAVGAGFGLLLGSTLLLRNELAIATVVLALAIVLYELRTTRPRSSVYAAAYGVPVLIVLLLFAGAYWRSYEQGASARASFTLKHDLNMCQVFAFNYQQRHPTRFTGNPFTDCRPLMRTTFGRPLPSFTYALRQNPGEVARFVAWNTRLLPAGIQVSLFGATSGNATPGYFPVKRQRGYALALTIVAVLVLLAGSLAAWFGGSRKEVRGLRRQRWTIALFGGVVLTTLVVALTQRPRPEYMYGFTITVMLLVGLGVLSVMRRLGLDALLGVISVVVIAGLCIAMPSYFHNGPRPIHYGLERLAAVARPLRSPTSVLVTTGYGGELCAYMATTYKRVCGSPSWPDLEHRIVGGEPVSKALDRVKATVIYADPVMQRDPALATFLTSPGQAGWRQIERGVGPDGPWSVLVRS
jgi:hypothetical protein